jgi:hypothetical protein
VTCLDDIHDRSTDMTDTTTRLKRVVLAEDDEGAVRATGPIYTDDGVERLRTEVEALGWENRGVVALDSASAFRAETRQAESGTAGVLS